MHPRLYRSVQRLPHTPNLEGLSEGEESASKRKEGAIVPDISGNSPDATSSGMDDALRGFIQTNKRYATVNVTALQRQASVGTLQKKQNKTSF